MIMTFTSSDMQRRPAVQIDTINIDAVVKQLQDAFHVASTGHKQQLHRGIEILRHAQLVVDSGPPNRIQRRLSAEAESQRPDARIQRVLPLEAQSHHVLQRARGELAGDPALQLLRHA